MERREFISTSVLASFAGMSVFSSSFAFEPLNAPKAITNKIHSKPLKPFYLPPDNSQSYRGGAKIRFDQVNNQFSAFEHVLPPKAMGPPPHVHKDLDEVMRAVKGTVTVMVGDELFDVKEGGWHLRPHGIVHTFWNATTEPVTVIDIYPNQNFDVFLDQANKLVEELLKKGISLDSKESISRIDILYKEWGIVAYHDQRKPLMEKYGLT